MALIENARSKEIKLLLAFPKFKLCQQMLQPKRAPLGKISRPEVGEGS